MSDRILVTGATGIVGSELVGLLVDEGVEVKAGTRNPALARDLFDPEVEVVELDYRQPATFDAAVEWADRVFLQPPPFSSDAYDTLAPLLDWAVQAGTEHVVALSAMGMEVRGDLPIRRLEKHVASLGVDYTFLRPNLLMQNFQRDFLGERIRGTGVFAMPVGDAAVSMVDGRDVAAVAAVALTGSEHMGRAYTLTGPEALTHHEMAEVLSEVSGRQIRFESCSDEEMLGWLTGAGWSPEVAGVVIALYQAVRAGVRASVSEEIEEVLHRPARSFRTFAQDHAEEWR
ncbi:MAG: NmrA family NAD(P)-binding protein [Gemmatimonadota bacterium]|nr:NmrA family NAD(P)-binding protein [Gemmatimonadota bacterium]